MNNNTKVIVLAVTFALALQQAHAADAAADTVTRPPNAPNDIPMPESPAAAALGTADTLLLRPSTAREFAVSLGQTVSRDGKLNAGISFEAAPVALFKAGGHIEGYSANIDKDATEKQGKLVRLNGRYLNAVWTMTNTTLSIATGAKQGSSTNTDKIALGIKVPIFDDGDPRLNYKFEACAREVDSTALLVRPVPPFIFRADPKDNRPEAEQKAEQKEAYDRKVIERTELKNKSDALRVAGYTACQKKSSVPWNASAAALAVAQVWTDVGDQKESKLKRDARLFWASYATDLGTSGEERGKQLVLQAKLSNDVVDKDTKVAQGAQPVRFDGRGATLRFKMGSPMENVDAAVSYERRKFTDGRSDKAKLASVGYERKIMADLWLKLDLGSERTESSGSKPFVATSIKWGSSNTPALEKN